jgi:hypothetical protein
MTAIQKNQILNSYRSIAAGPSDTRTNVMQRLSNPIVMLSVLEIQYAEQRGEIPQVGALATKSKRNLASDDPTDAYVVAQIRAKTTLPAKVVREFPGLLELWRARIRAYRALHGWEGA